MIVLYKVDQAQGLAVSPTWVKLAANWKLD